mmetsp:Transcript_21041/g.63302  ORF Transcript_21041/g.63302 Transcript_21041/m.63302 type:complete len:377 (-) Transcript_21041:2936-4066(-)
MGAGQAVGLRAVVRAGHPRPFPHLPLLLLRKWLLGSRRADCDTRPEPAQLGRGSKGASGPGGRSCGEAAVQAAGGGRAFFEGSGPACKRSAQPRAASAAVGTSREAASAARLATVYPPHGTTARLLTECGSWHTVVAAATGSADGGQLCQRLRRTLIIEQGRHNAAADVVAVVPEPFPPWSEQRRGVARRLPVSCHERGCARRQWRRPSWRTGGEDARTDRAFEPGGRRGDCANAGWLGRGSKPGGRGARRQGSGGGTHGGTRTRGRVTALPLLFLLLQLLLCESGHAQTPSAATAAAAAAASTTAKSATDKLGRLPGGRGASGSIQGSPACLTQADTGTGSGGGGGGGGVGRSQVQPLPREPGLVSHRLPGNGLW